MKIFKIALAAALLLPTLASANDLQTVIQRLELAERSLQMAQQEIGQAKLALYQMGQEPSRRHLCVYNYFGKQYSGRADTENEARENAIFQCSADRNNQAPGDCRYWSNKNGNMQCRQVNH